MPAPQTDTDYGLCMTVLASRNSQNKYKMPKDHFSVTSHK